MRSHTHNNPACSWFSALSLHPNAASLWLKAAAWEYERNANIAAARVMFQRGLRLNRQSKGEFGYLVLPLQN